MSRKSTTVNLNMRNTIILRKLIAEDEQYVGLNVSALVNQLLTQRLNEMGVDVRDMQTTQDKTVTTYSQNAIAITE
jgi:hypothetical protein